MLIKPPLTINETQKGLVNKEFSAVDLVDSYLDMIEKINPKLNAINTVAEELAHKKAKRVDKLISDLGKKATDEFPLLGVTVIYKDLFLTKGIRTTASSNVLREYIPQYSATVVNKLEAAGSITLGKSNNDAWAHGASGENSDFGPIRNPWNTDFVPGGSSSGSAASVAAGLSLIAMGTDTGGSVRQPANFTHTVGLKPTYGRVSRYGVIAMASSFDTIGHITRTVEESSIVLSVTQGEDKRDSNIAKEIKTNKSKISIGIPKEFFIEGLDKEISEDLKKVIKTYKNLGYEIKEVSLPHTKYAISVYYIIQPAEVSSNLGRYDGIRYGNNRESFGDEAKRRIMLGTYVLSSGYYDAYYLKAMKVRSKIIKDYDDVFKVVDVLITPVSPTPPFKIGEKVNDPLKMYLADVFTVSANIVGIPGLAVPSGFSKQGLPLGFQLLGKRFSEDILFELGNAYQKETRFDPQVAEVL